MKKIVYQIPINKELEDIDKLSKIIENSNWVSKSMIIVNCSPDYSSICTQMVNHKLSHLNDNELFEQMYLELPYPNMSQIWNRDTCEYEYFDRYLSLWVAKYIKSGYNYLFVDSATIRGKNFNKVKLSIKQYLDPNEYKFASLYVEEKSIFLPDFYVEKYCTDINGELTFSWENENNPNWK